jgi:Fe-S cluster assembly iron-binding protein IscA
MLAITEDAATAIDSMVLSGLPERAGLRITQEVSVQSGGEERTNLRLSVVASAMEGDQVLEGVRVFVAPEAAEFLDDKLLDADVDGEEVQFSLDVQAESR